MEENMKKVLSVLLATATALTVCGGLAACGDNSGTPNADDPNTITIWAPLNSHGNDTKGYKSMIKGFKEQYPEYANYNFKFVAKGEGEVQGAMGNNPAAGAEVFFFASDHYGNMRHNNYLQPLTTEYETAVKGRDAQGTYEFVTDTDNKIYAFPATNDNGYFLWYNDQLVTEEQVKSLDTLLPACKAKGVHFNFPYGTAWYSGSFFFGLGCEFNYTDSSLTHYHGDFNTPEGKAAGAAMLRYASSDDNKISDTKKVISSATSFSAGMADGSIAAAVSYVSSFADIEKAVIANNTDKTTGAVDEAAVEEALSHIKATVLPTFKATVEGDTEKDYHMGTFYGGKYCGVNRAKSEAKIKVSLALADWFTNQAGQTVRFNLDGSGPSNLAVAATEAVQNSIGLKAYNAQVALGTDVNCVQGVQSEEFWGNSGISAFATGVFQQDAGFKTVSEINAKLDALAAALNK